MLVRPYEMPWRPAYEAWAAAAWLLGLLYFVYITGSRALFTPFALTLSAFAMLPTLPGSRAKRSPRARIPARTKCSDAMTGRDGRTF